jgi:hypothetical protein
MAKTNNKRLGLLFGISFILGVTLWFGIAGYLSAPCGYALQVVKGSSGDPGRATVYALAIILLARIR